MADIKGGVEIYLDFAQYGSVITQKMAQLTASSVVNAAKRTVRKRSKNLMNSIKSIHIDSTNYIVTAGGPPPYAAIQEWGPPNTPFWSGRRYSWTPYMEPSAEEAKSPSKVASNLKDAENAALMAARRNRG